MLRALEADRAHIADIDAQIRVLEGSISVLRAQKALVQERLDSYTYPVLILPNEITSEIFIHFLPPYPDCPPLTGLFSPNLLTSICRTWREIAIDLPVLWRAICFDDVSVQLPYFELHIHIIDTWLRRSRSCPLSFEINNGDLEIYSPSTLAAIHNYRSRLEYLVLHLHHSHIPTIEGPMSLLRHLDLQFDESPPKDLLLYLKAPLLRTAILDDAAALHVILPWAQLTELTLSPVFPHECVSILRQTSTLVQCELHLACCGYARLPEVQLPRLESLILQEVDDEPIEGYFETFTVPALRSLHVPENFLERDPIGALSSFISKSGCKLEHLCVTGPISIIKDLKDYRCGFPFITKLSFDGWGVFSEDEDEDGMIMHDVDELYAHLFDSFTFN
ncbi:F-box domain-containing protein [Mycena venus]|uniref:F-box domain-containing protein n=1 Tax=Mycena venus TaxID=2733690 RepID=A0A8H6X7U7_9AGAR|nr:F-box domain-containing protein [Mycena venus]